MKTMTYEERMEDLKTEYNDFIKTKRGQDWQMFWKRETGSEICGDFGDYLYDFYPEMLQ